MLAPNRSLRSRRPRRREAPPPPPDHQLATAEKALRRGRRSDAARIAMTVAAEVRQDPHLLNRVGDLFARLGTPARAATCYLAAADRHREEGFQPKASALYRKLLRLDPDHPVARARLADLYQAQGLTAEAAIYGPAACAAAG